MEGEQHENAEEAVHCRKMGEARLFSPSPTVAPVPILGLLHFSGLSYCCGFGKNSLFTGNKLDVFPIASLGQGGGKSWLFLLLRKP